MMQLGLRADQEVRAVTRGHFLQQVTLQQRVGQAA